MNLCVLVVGCSRLFDCVVVVAGSVCVFTVSESNGLFVLVVVSFRPVSASSLNTLRCVQVWSIDPVVCGGPYPSKRVRNLVLEKVSRLDAFSGYPVRTWLSSGAPGGTTGRPEVRPSRSSRTRDRFPQVSDARGG